MNHQRSLLALAAATLLLAAACQQESKPAAEEKNHLSTELVNNPATANGFPEAAAPADATMDFADSTVNFGTITEGEVVTHEFTFTNNGKEPLLISDAQASCGCTVPEFTRDPVPPGASGTVKVSFNSKGKPGHQEKTVTIHSNSNRGRNMLHLTADVNSK